MFSMISVQVWVIALPVVLFAVALVVLGVTLDKNSTKIDELELEKTKETERADNWKKSCVKSREDYTKLETAANEKVTEFNRCLETIEQEHNRETIRMAEAAQQADRNRVREIEQLKEQLKKRTRGLKACDKSRAPIKPPQKRQSKRTRKPSTC